MQHYFRRYFVKQLSYARLVANIHPLETIARIAAHSAERLEIAGVSQFVNIDDAGVRFIHEITAYRRPNKARAACYNDAHKKCVLILLKNSNRLTIPGPLQLSSTRVFQENL